MGVAKHLGEVSSEKIPIFGEELDGESVGTWALVESHGLRGSQEFGFFYRQ
jgi:hypothetical protein